MTTEESDLTPREEEQKELEEMTLPRRIQAIKPLTSALLKVLSRKSTEPYFDTKITEGYDKFTNGKIKMYFHAAFYDRLRYYVPIIVVTILTLNVVLPHATAQAYGLAVDVLGATIIARGLFRGPEDIKLDSTGRSYGAIMGGTPHTYSPKQITSTTQDTVDGILGTSILILGFTLQFIGSIGVY